MKQSESDQGPSETLNDLIQSFGERKHWAKADSEHQWPASRLTNNEMTALRRLSNQVGRPVNQLIRESVVVYVRLMEAESNVIAKEKQTQSITWISAIDMACCQAMGNTESNSNETLEEIHTQLQLLNQTLDDLQSDVQWGLRNIVHHLAEPTPNPPPPVADSDQQGMLMLRDLISAPELQQAEVCDATRATLENILRKISSNRADEPKLAKVAEGNDAQLEPTDTNDQTAEPETDDETTRDDMLF